MPYLVLGIAIIIGLFLIIRGLIGLNPARAIKILLGVVLLAGLGATIYLIASRGLGIVTFFLAFLLPLLLRWRAAQKFFRNLGGPSRGQATGVNTRFIRMSLDHDSGILDGTVLEGPYKGQRLVELNQEELIDLLQQCRVEDEESAQVLEAYLDRVFGMGWRTDNTSSDYSKKTNSSKTQSSSGNKMTREEAYEILNVSPGASSDEIKAAHHTLMKKIHPDQGGSNYLASKINQAKEILIGD